MKKAIKKKWIKALRSKEYQQGKYTLRSSDNEFCCLGVLCDLYARENSDISWDDNSGYPDHYTFDGRSMYLPITVRQWAGLDESNPLVKTSKGRELSLGVLNDNDDFGLTFKGISDAIERSL